MIGLFAVLLLVAVGYQLAATWLVYRFVGLEVEAFAAAAERPPVSQLKPVNGPAEASRECFLSFLGQDYPSVQTVFTSALAEDAALDLASELGAEIVPGPAGPGSNRKIAALVKAYPACRHDLVVVSDADMSVPADYLQRVAAPFRDEATGMVTALYAVRRARGLAQALEGVSIADFAASVLVARKTEGISFGLGATMAFRREALEQAGGFEAVLDYLADDYQLGNRVARAGWAVKLAPVVVEDVLGPTRFGDYFSHQLRWMRTYRVSRPGGHFAFVMTQGLPWALALGCLSGGKWLLGWLACRLACAAAIQTRLGWSGAPLRLGVTLVKDALYLVLWLLSLAGNRVVWGGRTFEVQADGRMREKKTG